MHFEYTLREKELLDKHLHFYEELDFGSCKPTTKAQQHFVSVCRGYVKPRTAHENAYVKYKVNLREQKSKKRVTKGDDIIKSILKDTKEQLKKDSKRKVPIPDMKPGGVPDFEEGTASDDFMTAEGSKKMRGQVRADYLRRKSDFNK